MLKEPERNFDLELEGPVAQINLLFRKAMVERSMDSAAEQFSAEPPKP